MKLDDGAGRAPHGAAAAIYARVSPRPKKPGRGYSTISTEEQVRICREECLRNGWRVRYVLVDRLESASDINRPKLQQLLSLADDGRVGVIVVWKLDRMWRSLRDAVNLFDFFTRRNIAFHSCTERFDNSSPFGRFVFRNVASAAELERELIRERTQLSVHWRAREGYWMGATTPFGYVRSDNGQLVSEPAEAKLVRQIYGLYLRLKTIQAVADHLNERQKYGRDGREWNHARVHRVLTNPLYTGRLVQAGVEHLRRDLRIITDAAFVTAGDLRQKTRRNPPRSAPASRRDSAMRSIFTQYTALLDEAERAGEIAAEDPLGNSLANLKAERERD